MALALHDDGDEDEQVREQLLTDVEVSADARRAGFWSGAMVANAIIRNAVIHPALRNVPVRPAYPRAVSATYVLSVPASVSSPPPRNTQGSRAPAGARMPSTRTTVAITTSMIG